MVAFIEFWFFLMLSRQEYQLPPQDQYVPAVVQQATDEQATDEQAALVRWGDTCQVIWSLFCTYMALKALWRIHV
jgi:hypothetical protein